MPRPEFWLIVAERMKKLRKLKQMKNLKNSFNGHDGEDVMSYVSGIANMEGGVLVIGVMDKTLEIVGTDMSQFNLDVNSAVYKIKENCTNVSSEGLYIEEFVTSDTKKVVWIIHIPKHLPKLDIRPGHLPDAKSISSNINSYYLNFPITKLRRKRGNT